MFKTLSLAAAFIGCTAILSAQAVPADADTLKVTYFTNSSPCDSTIRMTDPGTTTANGGDVCADIYVFDANQELAECCSCLLTPDGLLTLSLKGNLLGNPLTGIANTPTSGVIKIISAAPTAGACPLPTKPVPAASIRAWATHIQNWGYVTESAFLDAGLSAAELSRVGEQCRAIQEVGSGAGVCRCPTTTG
jgi:hypothetical protein